jgi:hypothetical protein
VASGEVKVIAELLDCGVDVDAVAHHSYTRNALMYSSQNKDLDTVRFLLQRGASTDHVDREGWAADALCWFRSDGLTIHSSMDIFNLLTENSYLETNDDFHYRTPTLCIAASNACGAQIDALVRLGADVFLDETSEAHAINHAAWFGNYSSYSALASYYDEDAFRNNTTFASQLLFDTICGRKHRLCDPSEALLLQYRGWERSPEYDKIMIDLFRRGVGPRVGVNVADPISGWSPPGVHYRVIGVDKIVALLGPDTEAWYLSLLQRCGLLAHGDYRRLRELAEAGHVAPGFVYDIAEEPDEVDHGMRGDREEDGGVLDLGQEDVHPDTDGFSRRSSISEAGDASQFWDAEESF